MHYSPIYLSYLQMFHVCPIPLVLPSLHSSKEKNTDLPAMVNIDHLFVLGLTLYLMEYYKVIKSRDSRARFPTLESQLCHLLCNFVVCDKLLTISVTLFSHLLNGYNNKSSCLPGLL